MDNYKHSMSSFNSYLKTIKDITLLTYGESDLDVEKEIKTSVINALLKENDKYAPSEGMISTREIITHVENKKLNGNYKNDEVIITNGATEGLYLTICSIFKENDEVILLSPYYPEYEELLNIKKIKKIICTLDASYQIDEKELLSKITKKTKGIIINTPNNPSGAILNEVSINIITKIIKKYNIYLIMDNVYDSLNYTKMFYPPCDIKERLIVINSLSKSHNLTGWRLGYVLSNKAVIDKLKTLKQKINVSNTSFLQIAMKEALLVKPKYVDEYKKNVNLIYKTLKDLKISVTKPDAGFYLFFNIDSFNMDSISFCKLLGEEYKIGLMPGVFFHKDNYVRLSCVKKYKEMLKIQKRLKKAFKNLQSK